MSAARDVEVEDTATDADVVLGPETRARGFGAWKLATIGALALAVALCVTWTVSQGVPGPAVRHQPGALSSLQAAEELPQFGCVEDVVMVGVSYEVDNGQCVAACQNQDGCEFVMFTSQPQPEPTITVPTAPTAGPTAPTTAAPTALPTAGQTVAPTAAPTASPTAAPTTAPTASPTTAPTVAPTTSPTAAQTTVLTASPTATPTAAPTASPTATPATAPTASPTAAPTAAPTALPTVAPTTAPTTSPTAATKQCVDAAATNKWGDTCKVYTDHLGFCPSLYDDSDFTAELMCCACKLIGNWGGGPWLPHLPAPPVPNCVLGRGACTPKSAPDVTLTFLNKAPTLVTSTMSPTDAATSVAASQATVVSCGKGCSNWGDIQLDKATLELDDCKAYCDALGDCAAYNYQLDDCEGAPGAKTCYLFRSGCQVVESACWTLFEKQG